MKRLPYLYLFLALVAGASACGNSEGGTFVGTGGGAGTGGSSGGATGGSSHGGKGGSVATGGGAGTSASGGSTAGSGGSAAGSGGSAAGSGGSAGAPAVCPESVPADGSSCDSPGQSCFYQDCAGAGLSAAQCVGSSWSVETSACAVFSCAGFGDQCTAGQICSVTQGGAIFATCMDNPCGTGPVTCACVNPGCGTCYVNGFAGAGITVTCNTCPQGGCP